MKKIYLLTILAMFLAMMVTIPSCKDDDDPKDNTEDPNNNGESDEEEAPNTVLKYWDVVGQLVGIDQYTENYQDATFEPTIGEAEGNTRYIATNDMAAAAQRFADLVGASIDESTTTYKYEDPEVGTLTYTKVDDGTTLATVDVSIKQIPHLDKIVYRAGSDENGAFGDQKAWYRFGDIVKRTVDGVDEYWICVRPAFTYEKKEESHWVCINALPEKNNIHFVDGSNGRKYYVPKNLGKDLEDTRNFAEMLYAICYPQEWYDNCAAYASNGMPIFTDFKFKYIGYHNKYFWQKVQNAWSSIPEVSTALNCSVGQLLDCIKNDGVNVLYSGYSWWENASWNLSLYQANYTIGNAAKEKNMHKETLTTVKKNVKAFAKDFDCRTMGQDKSNYNEFFGDNKLRWVIRHATGTQLNGGNELAPTAEIQGVTEGYRYYSHYPEEKARKGKDGSNGPEVSVALSRKTYYHAGDIIKRNSDGTPWLCVRPAGGPDNEKNSYWICLSPFDQNGNCIIPESTEQYDGKTFKYAQNLMSQKTAQAACHTFCRLSDSRMIQQKKYSNAELVNARIKAAGYNLMNLNSDYGSDNCNKGYASYNFAFGSPATDQIVNTKRKYKIQPFLGMGVEEDLSESLATYNMVLQEGEGIVGSLMSLTDGYEADYMADFILGDIWPDSYDFHNFLHKYVQGQGLNFIHNDVGPGYKIGAAWLPNPAKYIIVSPEIMLEDNDGVNRPASASQFADVFVSNRDLNGKYFDYWSSLGDIELNIDKAANVNEAKIKETL